MKGGENTIKRQFHLKCRKCGNEWVSGGPYSKCPECGTLYSKRNFKCKKCGHSLTTPSQICPECGYVIKYRVTCDVCNKEYMVKDRLNFICPECGTPKFKKVYTCKKCGEVINSPNSKCSNCGYNPYKNSKFYYKKCGAEIATSLSTCTNCGYNPHDNFKDCQLVCPKCGLKYSAKRNINAKYLKCGTKYTKNSSHEAGICIKCGKYAEHRNAFGIGIDCGCLKALAIESTKPKFCHICGKITPHNGNRCLVCNPQSNFIANFIIKDSALFYKGVEIHELCNQIINGEISLPNDDYLGFNIRFNRVCYNNYDILENLDLIKDSQENDKFSWLDGSKLNITGSNFAIKNDVEFIFDKYTGDYREWESFKRSFLKYIKNLKTNHLEGIQGFVDKLKLEMNLNAEIMPTFISKETPKHCGHAAFDHYLSENDIKWFAYIKFFTLGDEASEIKPLVVGKSGSNLVNASGSDLSFSTDVNDGPARRLLKETNSEWYYPYIVVIPCVTEEDAYLIENNIQKEYHLFGS